MGDQQAGGDVLQQRHSQRAGCRRRPERCQQLKTMRQLQHACQVSGLSRLQGCSTRVRAQRLLEGQGRAGAPWILARGRRQLHRKLRRASAIMCSGTRAACWLPFMMWRFLTKVLLLLSQRAQSWPGLPIVRSVVRCHQVGPPSMRGKDGFVMSRWSPNGRVMNHHSWDASSIWDSSCGSGARTCLLRPLSQRRLGTSSRSPLETRCAHVRRGAVGM